MSVIQILAATMSTKRIISQVAILMITAWAAISCTLATKPVEDTKSNEKIEKPVEAAVPNFSFDNFLSQFGDDRPQILNKEFSDKFLHGVENYSPLQILSSKSGPVISVLVSQFYTTASYEVFTYNQDGKPLDHVVLINSEGGDLYHYKFEQLDQNHFRFISELDLNMWDDIAMDGPLTEEDKKSLEEKGDIILNYEIDSTGRIVVVGPSGSRNPLTAKNENELWKAFISKMKGTPGAVIESGEFPSNEFTVEESDEEDFGKSIYKLGPRACTERLIFISKRHLMEGAFGFKATDQTFVSLKISDKYIMFSEPIEGYIKDCLSHSDNEYFLLTFQDSGDQIAAFRKTEYNVYNLNVDEQTIKKVASKVGELEVWNDEGEYDEESMSDEELMSVRSSTVHLDQDSAGFTLIEYRARFKEGRFQPYDTLTTHYFWDKKSKSFTKS